MALLLPELTAAQEEAGGLFPPETTLRCWLYSMIISVIFRLSGKIGTRTAIPKAGRLSPEKGIMIDPVLVIAVSEHRKSH